MKSFRRTFIGICLLFVTAFAQDTKENADFKLAVSLYNDKLYDLALEQFRSFVDRYPASQQSIEARFYLGLTQMNLKQYDDARSTFQNFALSYPENSKAPEAWFHVAESYVALGKKQEAAYSFERVKTFHPRSKQAPIALLQAAAIYEDLGDKENMRRVLTTLTAEYSTPEVLQARLKLAELLIEDKNSAAATQECRTVISATNDNKLKARALFILSKAFIDLGKFEDADQTLSDLITNYSSTESYYNALFTYGLLHLETGNIIEARTRWSTLYEKAQAPPQLRQDAALSIAETYIRSSEYKKALEWYSKAYGIEGAKKFTASFYGGLISEYLHDTLQAAQWFERAQIDTNDSRDRFTSLYAAYKASCYTKRYSDALQILHTMQQEVPSSPFLPSLLIEGASLSIDELNEPSTAIELCHWILRNAPHSQFEDDAYYFIGLAYRKAENYEAALETFEKLLQRYPASEFYDDAIKQQWYIETFDYQQKGSSIQKLAELLGDVIAERSRGELAYRLAEIYFYDLKDYERAAVQFTATLQQNVPDTLRQRAWYFLGQSYEYLAMSNNISTSKGSAYLSKALASYDSLIHRYPQSQLAEEATVASYKIQIQSAHSPDELRRISATLNADPSIRSGKERVLFTLGNSYLAEKQYSDAVVTYKLLLEKYPKSSVVPTAFYQLVNAYSSLGAKDSAKVVYQQYLERFPDHYKSAQASLTMAQTYNQSHEPDKALQLIQTIKKKYYYTLAAMECNELEADAAFIASKFQLSSKLYQSLLDSLRSTPFLSVQYPQRIANYFYQLGVCYDSLHLNREAQHCYAQYITYDRSSERTGTALKALIQYATETGNVNLATYYLKMRGNLAAKSGGSNSTIAYETAQLLFDAGKYSDALDNYLEAQKQITDENLKPIIDGQIVRCAFCLDRLDDANKRAAEFIKKYPKEKEYPAIFEYERGAYFMRKEKFDVAKQYFTNVIKKYPKASIVPEAMYWNARLYEIDGKFPRAVAVYDSLLQFYPKHAIIPKVRLSLGNVYYAMEQWEAAARQYRIVLDSTKAPELAPIAMSNLILAYKEMEMFDVALDLTRKFIDEFPTDSTIIDKKIDIGLLYQKLGYYQQAIVHFQSLIVPGNNDLEAELRYYIGESYFLKGDYQQAVLEFLKVPYLVTKVGKIDWAATSYYMAGQSYEKLAKPDQAIQMYQQIIDRKESDAQFKTAAQKEIERVKTIMGTK